MSRESTAIRKIDQVMIKVIDGGQDPLKSHSATAAVVVV